MPKHAWLEIDKNMHLLKMLSQEESFKIIKRQWWEKKERYKQKHNQKEK